MTNKYIDTGFAPIRMNVKARRTKNFAKTNCEVVKKSSSFDLLAHREEHVTFNHGVRSSSLR